MTITTRQTWANRIVGHADEPPEGLLAHPSNWRLHPPSQQRALAEVLGEVGLVQSVIKNVTTGRLLDGHLRVELALASGQPSIPVVLVELSEEEERVILATLDPIGAMASADREKLSELLAGVENPDLAELLEAVARANRIALDFGGAGLTDPDDVPELPEEPLTQPGDLWLLGPHRLLCGDSTNRDDVSRLMDGRRASLIATDPPYLVDYQGGSHPASEANAGAPSKDKHWDAYIDHEHTVEFYIAFLRCALEHALTEDAAIYQWFGIMRCGGSGSLGHEFV